MSISENEYGRLAKKYSPPSPIWKDCLSAFLTGGLICTFAEGLNLWFSSSMSEKESRSLAMIIVIAITAVLTGIGVFDNIAKHAGAGTMVPITGFANSIVSPAMEFRAEGTVTGTATQMFSIAGPVIVFGCSSAALYGLIIYIFNLY
ncbi:MAG: stage V sporulation protein AC [Clostridia bacterium]|nr:stage V sporulation protein AC [Clostridia bacterium]